AAGQLIAQVDLETARTVANQARADLQGAESQVQQAQAAVDQAKGMLDHTIISSPIDGIVVARNVDVGQTVAATIQAPTLFSIANDLTHMQVRVDVDESDIGGVHPGERATFEVESYPDQEFDGVVEQVRLQPVAEQTAPATTAGPPSTSPSTA